MKRKIYEKLIEWKNTDMTKINPNYVVRMTSNDKEGKEKLDDFIDANTQYPVIATTSKLLSTGVDTKTIKLIVLDSEIQSMTEFKQIIGRGTRLLPNKGKEFFTIMDFSIKNIINFLPIKYNIFRLIIYAIF